LRKAHDGFVVGLKHTDHPEQCLTQSRALRSAGEIMRDCYTEVYARTEAEALAVLSTFADRNESGYYACGAGWLVWSSRAVCND
jgi:hypothetical protein